MTKLQRIFAGAALVGFIAIGVEVLNIHAERTSTAISATSNASYDADDLVFLKRERPSTLADLSPLNGSTLWVSAAGQMEYYPYTANHIDFSKASGTLLGAQPLMIQQAFEEVAPKQLQARIPGGDKQVFLSFTMPKSSDPTQQYAVPVGYKKGSDYTFYTDDMFFYSDPHQLYSHWSKETWQAVDSHKVVLGMNERQAQLALGQVFRTTSQQYGDRVIVFANLGKPMSLTFEKNHVTSIRNDQTF